MQGLRDERAGRLAFAPYARSGTASEHATEAHHTRTHHRRVPDRGGGHVPADHARRHRRLSLGREHSGQARASLRYRQEGRLRGHRGRVAGFPGDRHHPALPRWPHRAVGLRPMAHGRRQARPREPARHRHLVRAFQAGRGEDRGYPQCLPRALRAGERDARRRCLLRLVLTPRAARRRRATLASDADAQLRSARQP